jgi:hypothetical protein
LLQSSTNLRQKKELKQKLLQYIDSKQQRDQNTDEAMSQITIAATVSLLRLSTFALQATSAFIILRQLLVS